MDSNCGQGSQLLQLTGFFPGLGTQLLQLTLSTGPVLTLFLSQDTIIPIFNTGEATGQSKLQQNTILTRGNLKAMAVFTASAFIYTIYTYLTGLGE